MSPRVGQSRKRDSNEAQIVQALRKCGASVLRISEVGAPDLLVSFRSGNRRELALLEVKTARGHATAAQRAFEREGWIVYVVRDVADALRVIGVEL